MLKAIDIPFSINSCIYFYLYTIDALGEKDVTF